MPLSQAQARESDPLIASNNAKVYVSLEPCKSNALTTDSDNTSHEMLGYFLMVLSTLFFSGIWLSTRFATAYGGISVPTVLFLRGFIQTAIGFLSTFLLLDYKVVFNLSPYLMRMVALRGIFGAVGLGCYCKCIALLPLPVASTFFFLSPAFTMILSHILIGEETSSVEVVATVISFIGAGLVSNPWQATPLSSIHFNQWVLGIFLGLLSSCFTATAFVTLRAIAPQISFMASVLSQGICVGILGVFLAGVQLKSLASDKFTAVCLILGCTAGFLGQCCLSKGSQYCRAGTGALMRNLNLPVVYILSILCLHEVPRVMGAIGSALVVTGSIILGIATHRRRAS